VRTGQLLDGLKEEWKPDLAVVKATIRFLEKTVDPVGSATNQLKGWDIF
jgi:hypothetical protein